MKRLITWGFAVLALGWFLPEGRAGGFTEAGSLPGGFSPTPDTLALLARGQWLFTRGTNAELYDPVAGGWTVTGSLPGTAAYTATPLPNGEVLAVDGPVDGALNTAALYNPATGAWSPTGPMTTAHGIAYTVTVLSNGQVLVAGGQGAGGAVASAELFDPGSGSWQVTGSLIYARTMHTATLLASGQVLVTGGWDPANPAQTLNYCELYNPLTRQWAFTGPMSIARGGATATLLPDGDVLVAGGGQGESSSVIYASAEVYHAGAGTWSLTGPMSTNRFEHAAVLLTNGLVLVTGGYTTYDPAEYINNATATAETYNPASQTWTPTGGHMHLPRVWLTGLQPLTLLTNGLALVAGGGATSGDADLELYDPADTLYFDYTTNGDAVTITNYTGNAGNVTIPAVINGLPVTTLGDNAFLGASGLTSLLISNGVAGIGDNAFKNCTRLTNATLPGSVTSIGSQAFYGCTSLTNLTLTNGLTSIGSDAFADSLTSVTVPATVTNIGANAFFTLRTINVAPANAWYSSQGGALFNQNGTVLVECPQVIGKYTIPSGVLDIGEDAFVECSGLTSVFVPASVTYLQDYAFEACPALAGVYFYGNAPATGSAGPFAGGTHPTIYYVSGTSGWGSAFDNLITQTWTPPPPPPTIETQPVSATNYINTAVLFSVQAIGTGPFGYQWQFNGANLAGTDTNAFRLTSVQLVNAGNYDVIVTNAGGSVTSSIATLTVRIPDTNPPTLKLVSPTPGLEVSNAVFTVTGTAQDNVAVARVVCSLNNAAWTNAVTTNGWTNWTAAVTLIPSTNTIAAYAIDTSGNVSTTNRATVIYVVSATLAVSTNGLGSLNPNDNGAVLQAGKNYAITATPAAGFTFSNWTGGTALPLTFITNKATVQFMMVSNLALQATFVETSRPVVAITSPVANQRMTNSLITVKGTAGDNWRVTNVWVRVNGGGWTNATGTTNWSASASLTPGTNAVQIYAAGLSGNLSLTNAVNFDLVVTNQLGLQTIGLGALSPNYTNEVWLEVGRNYTLTATPAAGFTFSNWTGGTALPLTFITNKATVQFMMVSNLALQATFVETSRPVVAITSPVANQRMTNSLITVKGTAGDNWRVTNVWVQVNGGGWTNATGTTNWSASASLTPGTNSVQVYAAGLSGNLSLTNAVNFDLVVTNQLQLQTIGLGVLSPNYSNDVWLEVGREYTLTATPATGFTFTNWAGGTALPLTFITNKATMQFMMASNLTLQATFVETSKPVVIITSPTANQRLSGTVLTIKGTTSDHWRVTNVWCEINSSGWTAAATTNNYNNWSVTNVILTAATNVIRVYAGNLGGLYSSTNSVTVVVTNFVVTPAVVARLATAPARSVGPITDAQMTAGGLTFNLQISGSASGWIQTSTNLSDWDTWTNFTGTNTTLNFCDPAATNSHRRFYRAVAP